MLPTDDDYNSRIKQYGSVLKDQAQHLHELIKSEYSTAQVILQIRSIPPLSISIDDENPREIAIGWHALDPTVYGSFEAGQNPIMIIISLNSYMLGHPNAPFTNRLRLSSSELEEWAKLSLGDLWYDYCYEVASTASLIRSKTTFMAVFISRQNGPTLAPRDFAWEWSGPTPPVMRRKIAPNNPSNDLKNLLMKVGDDIPVDLVGIPRYQSNEIWSTRFAAGILKEFGNEVQQLPDNRIWIEFISLSPTTVSVSSNVSKKSGNAKVEFEFHIEEFRNAIHQTRNSSQAEKAAVAAARLILDSSGVDGTTSGIGWSRSVHSG